MYTATQEDLRGIGVTVVCGPSDSKEFRYRMSDLRHMTALMDTLARAAKRRRDE